MDWARLLASRGFYLGCLFGLVIVAALVLDVPQGLSDQEVRSSYPLSVGPFLVLFGLHRAGHSLALWAVIIGLALHAGALVVTRRSGSKAAVQGGSAAGPRSRSIVLSVALILASVTGLAWTGGTQRPARAADPSRLRVRVTDAPGGPTTQVVEEGATYEVPHADGARTLLFGVASRGPYALERTREGRLRVHLSGLADESRPSVIGVEARRPAAGPPAGGPFGPIVAPRWFGLACAALAAFAVGVLARRGPSLASGEWRTASWMTASFLALLILNPLAGWGRSRTPLAATFGGEDVVWSAVVAGPGDTAPWLASIPAEIVLPGPWWLNLLAGATTLLLITAVLTSRAGREFPSGTVRAVAGAGAGLAALAGVAWLVHSLGRIPPVASGADLLQVFEGDVLPRIPMDIEVLREEVSSPGPYFVPTIMGLHAAVVAFASAYLLSRTARGRTGRTGPGMTTVRAATWTILAVAVVRSLAAALFEPAGGALPFALLALLVAALAPIVARLHPDWPASSLVTTLAAGVMLLAMP